MVMLSGSGYILGAIVVPGGGNGAWPELAGRFEQGAAQVLEQAQAVGRHGQAAPAAGGAVQHGPEQAQAGGLAGEAADDLGAAAGLAEGALDEVGVPDPVVVLRWEPQVGGQAFAVGEQALHRRRVGRRVPFRHRGDPVIDELDELGAGLGRQVFGIEQGPVGVLDLGLHPGRDLGQDISRAM